MNFTIDFKGVNDFIDFIESCKTITYNNEKNIYFFDGIEVREQFILETCSKFSHFINVINNNLLNKKLNIQSVKVLKEDLPSNIKELLYKPKKGAKNAKKE